MPDNAKKRNALQKLLQQIKDKINEKLNMVGRGKPDNKSIGGAVAADRKRKKEIERQLRELEK